MNAVDDYISRYDPPVQELLRQVRAAITEIAPRAEESISYGLPGYKINGKPLVYFGAGKKHIGFYATPSGHSQFSEELSHYKQGKGSVQFPFNKPLPLELIKKIVAFRVTELQEQNKSS